MFDGFIRLVREIYQTEQFIPLHEPRFAGNEKQYLLDVIDSTFVSSVGPYVGEFETKIAEYTGAKHAIATVNGTAALHVALLLAGVEPGEEVITQAVTFVATCNAIHYCGAEPVFVDVDAATLGLSPAALTNFLDCHGERRDGGIYNKTSGKRIAACLPMHSFGHPCDMLGLLQVCEGYGIPVVEDAAEALGSRIVGSNSFAPSAVSANELASTPATKYAKHCGALGKLGVLSFNGNKIITTGGGGMILTDDDELARHAKHLTTTAKLPHAWRFAHDQIGYNYRMPNLNAALGLAQLEQLPAFVERKRALAQRYLDWAQTNGAQIVVEPTGARSNYWLNALLLDDVRQRNAFLEYSNAQGVMTRPLWELMADLPMYKHCQRDSLTQSRRLAERLVNVPSSVVL
ncbi:MULTISPECIES: LegC family aminotransferase [Methylomonas]|uniref:Aminotransferase DegT n=2 Tax=Methylomonas TaxID=416 RepID=A0A126T6Q4_9GAMM|nr:MULTISPECIES: LegC family aminotransferase [Methylomonas]AMK77762.1 aminotransferase DegT [Methylomonas denitrificans]OAI08656.1 aminotransferase DegT [Methylomonas methanica]TCV86935.1 aminotransferase in exopolysaccharide biosynthesis [Methylomonas methanica]